MVLTSNDFHNEWAKIKEKHDKIINCCGIPRDEPINAIRQKFWDHVADLQELLKKVDDAKEISETKIMESLEPDEDFKRDDETESLLQVSLSIYRDIHGIQNHIHNYYNQYEEYGDDDSYGDDWVALCGRGVKCCLKQGKTSCNC